LSISVLFEFNIYGFFNLSMYTRCLWITDEKIQHFPLIKENVYSDQLFWSRCDLITQENIVFWSVYTTYILNLIRRKHDLYILLKHNLKSKPFYKNLYRNWMACTIQWNKLLSFKHVTQKLCPDYQCLNRAWFNNVTITIWIKFYKHDK